MYLGDRKVDVNRCLFRIVKESFRRIVETKVRGTIDENSLDADAEATIEAEQAVRLEDFEKTIAHPFELSCFTFTYVGA